MSSTPHSDHKPKAKQALKSRQKTAWGILPNDAIETIRTKEWESLSRLKNRFKGELTFPIRLNLKPPNGSEALENLEQFQHFIKAWQNFPHPDQIIWESRRYRQLQTQTVPKTLQIESIEALVELLGPEATERYNHWHRIIELFNNAISHPAIVHPTTFHPTPNLTTTLLQQIDRLDALSLEEAHRLATLLPQLRPNMGNGLYLRALPLKGVDTKCVETHTPLLSILLDQLHSGSVTEMGGLLNWLGCKENPRGWITIRPLCDDSQTALSNLPILQIDTTHLTSYPLPADNILIVENLQSGLALPRCSNTIAVMGCGNNIEWLSASWLQEKQVYYWGDIDSWGLTILSRVREKLPRLTALMMDLKTVERHQEQMVKEPNPNPTLPPHLTAEEADLFMALKEGRFNGSRLEQEKIRMDYVGEELERCFELYIG